jgi:hypothetical protein
MNAKQTLIAKHLSTVPVESHNRNNIEVTPEQVNNVSDELACLIHNMYCGLNDEPMWNSLTFEGKQSVKDKIARNPLWLSKQS